ncbi:MAG: Xaa-Pro peptidase family protein [Thermoproteus sp.]
MHKISAETLKRRINALGRRLAELGHDAYYITNPENIFYLTNYYFLQTERPLSLLVSTNGELALFAPMVEYEHFDLKSPLKAKEFYYFDYPGEIHPVKFIAEKIRELSREWGIRSIALESPAGAAGGWGYRGPDLAELLDPIKAAVLPDLVEDMRLVKDEEEVGLIEESARWAARGLDVARSLIAEGKYDWEVALEASLQLSREMARAYGVGYMPLREFTPGFVGFRGQVGEYSYYPHSISAPRPFRRGDVIGIGAGPEAGGYYSELERTLVLGSPTEEQKKYFEAMLELRNAAFEALGPDVEVAEVDRAVRRRAERLGVADKLRHHTGHGIGIGFHERPYIDIGYKGALQPGMVVTIEPGLYVRGLGGFRHSDTVLITRGGYRLLTKYPEEPGELTI